MYSDDNPLKFIINRFELRFRKAHARDVGQQVIEQIAYMDLHNGFSEHAPLSVTAIVAAIITAHFNFIVPTKTNKHRAALEPSWEAFIAAGLAANTDTARL